MQCKVSPVEFESARRREVFGRASSQYRFQESGLPAIDCGCTFPVNIDAAHGHRFCVCFFEQLLNPAFGLFILAFAEVLVAHFPRRIDEVMGRPVLIVERIPDCMIAVERDRIRIPNF